jgi:hypothetical protein
VAALELQAKPAATPGEIRQALIDGASPVGLATPDAVGAGLIDAPEAIADLTSIPFPGGTQFAQLTPQNCGFPRAPESNPLPANPPANSGPVTSETDSRRPSTFFRRHPGKTIRTHGHSARAVFRFGSDETDVSYSCRIDGGFFRRCPERLVRLFGVGSHAVAVIARDAAGNADRTSAVVRFRVKHVG